MAEEHGAYWDAQAAGYDRATRWLEPRLMTPARVWVAQRVRGEVLEVAAGTGANLPHYAASAAAVTLTDGSAAMLALARRRADEAGVAVRAVQADAARLPWPDASFDSVICTFALCCVSDEVVVLRELARVVRPDGRVLIADHVESSAAGWRVVQRGLDVLGRRHGEHHRRRPLVRLADAGLEAVETVASRHRLVEQVAARRAG
ncbi:class I SAM-dependent methyltransferase [Cellulomonas gilvus]|uniref:Methyltransferase type 11 n=1 Tax=Cellulomonas gilvus (strain ATCC 13127 / NRRL B-14078) TaxID=593907 RepID=F8A3Y4_CELGA|nr:class I SAM-dependent methyltransferase [Cellulomonas gilvus]AEI13176.1 Methyltransferase type 11 [Cellulomonas gilvus ATCC 13127]